MKLEYVITLANAVVELPFRALEKSLRASGCTLPLLVIPYNDKRFELPENSFWLDDKELFDFLSSHNAHPMMRKYACLTRKNYLFVDTDVAFLKNPTDFYAPYEGFVVNCTHWNNPNHTCTQESESYLKGLSTTYQKSLFNAGQFASCVALYENHTALAEACLSLPGTTLTFPYHDQPGLNYLVAYSKKPFTNLTLPPHNFESSWAGDYLQSPNSPFLMGEKAPCFLHWAGLHIDGKNPIDELFWRNLSGEQRQRLLEEEKSTPTPFNYRLREFLRAMRKEFSAAFGKK